jgi:hypothetical protein
MLTAASAREARMGQVAGRECGGCSVCCNVLPIGTAELRKQAGVACKHCVKGGGCGIYETRPHVCRGYSCGWLTMPDLGDDWRPDKSGVFITSPGAAIPAHFENRNGIELMIASAGILGQRPFLDLVCILVEKRIPAFLAIQGPAGHFPASIFMNDDLAEPVSRKNRQAVADLLGVMHNRLTQYAFVPVPMPPRA